MSPYYYVVFLWFAWPVAPKPQTVGVSSAKACDVFLREQEIQWHRYFDRNPQLLSKENPVSRWILDDNNELLPAARSAFFIISRIGGRLMISAHCLPREQMSPAWDLDSKPQPR